MEEVVWITAELVVVPLVALVVVVGLVRLVLMDFTALDVETLVLVVGTLLVVDRDEDVVDLLLVEEVVVLEVVEEVLALLVVVVDLTVEVVRVVGAARVLQTHCP